MKKFSEIKEDFTDWIIGATKEDFLNVVIIYSKRLGLIALGFVLALIVNVIFFNTCRRNWRIQNFKFSLWKLQGIWWIT